MSRESFERTPMGFYFRQATSEAALRAFLATRSREDILQTLQENDRNGIYLDSLQDEDADPVTHEEAVELVVECWKEDQS